MKRVSAVAITLAFLAAVLTGCAWRGDAPDVADVAYDLSADAQVEYDRVWSCVPVAGPGTGELTFRGDGWSADGGRMISTHVSSPDGPELPGRSSPEEALGDAVASATEAALGLLEQRGVAYAEVRRRGIVGEAVRASHRGDEIPFPRMSVVRSVLEECVAEDTAAPPDTCWRAAVLVEYPIGYLRGDANNVRWERSRAANEARTLLDSAACHFGNGLWLDGLLEAARVAEIVYGAGLPVTAFEASPAESTDGRAAADPATTRLVRTLDSARRLVRGVSPVEATPAGGVVVIEAGAAAPVEVAFELTCRLNSHDGQDGFAVPAVGVPVVFRMEGASAILDADPVTDSSGTARCRILRVHGSPGEYELEVRVDEEAVTAALLWFCDPSIFAGPPLAAAPVHVVSGAHATSVCFDLDSEDDADAAQTLAGFTRRMERDGFRVDGCGPGVAVIVTGRVRVAAFETDDGWGARALLTASAFDQRTASQLGETSIRADESIAVEASGESRDDGKRRAEVLALKEAGRLLAVYFGGRVLSSGS